MKSVMNNRFSHVPSADIPRSVFDRSCGHKTTFDAGYLVPVFLDEALPGDSFNLKASIMARLATPIFPIFDNIFMDFHFFAVPVRLVFNNWHKFNGAQDNPGDSTDYSIPTLDTPATTGFVAGDLGNYLGIPIGLASKTVNSLPFRCYNLIYNEWYRDENLQNSVVVDKDDGPDDVADYVLLRRGKRYDYFTSCLPWPQKSTAVDLPLGTSAPVYGDGNTLGLTDGTYTMGLTARNTGAGILEQYDQAYGQALPFTVSNFTASSSSNKALGVVQTGTSGLYADLSTATAATINELREAFQLQKLYERDARSGTRLTEIIRAHFGVMAPDYRLQRPEYLGGGSVPVNIHPVQQTSSTDGTSPQGNLAAFGTVAASNIGFTKSFVEHCYILGIVSVRADLNYQQGLDRLWSRSTRFDFYWPSLSHIGEQAVLLQEIFADGTAADETVFGYQGRYDEYRYKTSLCTGQMSSLAATPLDAWHLAQEFASAPSLDATFIVENPPIDRVIADATDPHFIFDSYFKYKCARPMPVYPVPGLIDHF